MQQTKHVLVAEDNLAMLGVIRFVLEAAELKVTTVTNGRAAWDSLGAGDVDLVISDFNMPEMTGGELCERMRKDPRFERIPIILLTAKGLELDKTRFLDELSVSAIVSKPFSPRAVLQTVQNLLAVETAGA